MTGITSAIVKELISAGVTGDALVTALERIENAHAAMQKPRSAAAVRQARYRERLRGGDRESVTSDVTSVTSDAKETTPLHPPKENPPFKEKPPLKGGQKESIPPSQAELLEAVQAWNELASMHGLPRCSRLTERRRKALAARLADCGGINGFRDAVYRIRGSPFLLGDNDRGWTADFDFVLQESSFVKLQEGKYNGVSKPAGKTNGSHRPKPTRADIFAEIDRRIAELEATELGADQGGQGDAGLHPQRPSKH